MSVERRESFVSMFRFAADVQKESRLEHLLFLERGNLWPSSFCSGGMIAVQTVGKQTDPKSVSSGHSTSEPSVAGWMCIFP